MKDPAEHVACLVGCLSGRFPRPTGLSIAQPISGVLRATCQGQRVAFQSETPDGTLDQKPRTKYVLLLPSTRFISFLMSGKLLRFFFSSSLLRRHSRSISKHPAYFGYQPRSNLQR